MKKTVLITGAVGGIGKALCSEFAKADYRVLATDKVNNPDIVCDAFLQADLVDICHSEKKREEILSEVHRWLGENGLNVLINNAALQVLGPSDSITVTDWSASMDVNVTAPFLLVQGLLPELEKAGGSVVNVASVHSRMTKPRFVSYATSKAALVGLTRALAVDLGGRIRINAINPAAVETNMLLEGFEGRSDLYDDLKSMHPIKRIANPEEIAKVALFLASDQASFITGGVLDVDGGILSRLHDPD